MKQNTHHYNRKRRKKTNKAAKACRKGKLQLAQYEGEEVTLHAVIQRISAPTITGSEIGYQKTICVEFVRIVEDNFQRKKLCDHMWLHTNKIKNLDFVLAHAEPHKDIIFKGYPELYFFDSAGGSINTHKYGLRDIIVTMIGSHDYVEGVGEVERNPL